MYVALLLSMVTGACSSPPEGPTTRPGAAGAGNQCVPEGQSCAEPRSACCAGSSCARIGKPVCILDY
ncbi:hypothetical protein [Rubrivivax albus]|nr:hypothetical protein [Rubrivivax albus]